MLCLCGCGNKTKLSTITNSRLGLISGKPNKYLRGHNKPWLGKRFDNFDWKIYFFEEKEITKDRVFNVLGGDSY